MASSYISVRNIIIIIIICRQIFSQFHEKSKKNISFTLIKNEILKKINHVFMF